MPALETQSSVGSKLERYMSLSLLWGETKCWEKRRRSWVQWEVLLSALGHFPIQVLQVSLWKLLHFLRQPPTKLHWKSLPAKEGVVLSSPVILFNGHSFYNLNYNYTPRHWPFSFGLQSVLLGSQKSGYFCGDKGRHEQTVWLGNIALWLKSVWNSFIKT